MKLNLGCGDKKLPGFVNIDIREEVEPDVVDDVTLLETIEENSVDLIYACHVLEHFELHECWHVLNRWYDVLKVDGILRVSVPDMDAVFAHYFYWKDFSKLRGYIWGGQSNKFDYHKTGWDYDTLKELLEDAGFDNVKRWDWQGTSPHDYIDDYSQAYYPTKNCIYTRGCVDVEGKLMSLNIQATKVVDE